MPRKITKQTPTAAAPAAPDAQVGRVEVHPDRVTLRGTRRTLSVSTDAIVESGDATALLLLALLRQGAEIGAALQRIAAGTALLAQATAEGQAKLAAYDPNTNLEKALEATLRIFERFLPGAIGNGGGTSAVVRTIPRDSITG